MLLSVTYFLDLIANPSAGIGSCSTKQGSKQGELIIFKCPR